MVRIIIAYIKDMEVTEKKQWLTSSCHGLDQGYLLGRV